MTTLEEMVETFLEAGGGYAGGAPKAMAAVLEKHVGPMLAEAHNDGAGCVDYGRDYAARIISQLTKQNERAG